MSCVNRSETNFQTVCKAFLTPFLLKQHSKLFTFQKIYDTSSKKAIIMMGPQFLHFLTPMVGANSQLFPAYLSIQH